MSITRRYAMQTVECRTNSNWYTTTRRISTALAAFAVLVLATVAGPSEATAKALGWYDSFHVESLESPTDGGYLFLVRGIQSDLSKLQEHVRVTVTDDQGTEIPGSRGKFVLRGAKREEGFEGDLLVVWSPEEALEPDATYRVSIERRYEVGSESRWASSSNPFETTGGPVEATVPPADIEVKSTNLGSRTTHKGASLEATIALDVPTFDVPDPFVAFELTNLEPDAEDTAWNDTALWHGADLGGRKVEGRSKEQLVFPSDSEAPFCAAITTVMLADMSRSAPTKICFDADGNRIQGEQNDPSSDTGAGDAGMGDAGLADTGTTSTTSEDTGSPAVPDDDSDAGGESDAGHAGTPGLDPGRSSGSSAEDDTACSTAPTSGPMTLPAALVVLLLMYRTHNRRQ